MSALILLIIFLIAFVMGLIGNISGIGGGVMILLLLIYGFGFSPIEASGLSLLTLVFSSSTGLVQHMRNRLVDMKLLAVIAPLAVMGAVAGTVIARYIPSTTFKGVFSAILIVLGFFSVISARRQKMEDKEDYSTESLYSASSGGASLIAGIVSGFVGIGIGGIMGTYLTAIRNAKPKIAIATIVSATLPVTLTGAAAHFYYTGLFNLIYAPSLVIGAFIGALIGARIIKKAPQMSLRFLQGYIIIFFGALSSVLFVLTEYVH